MQLPRLLTPNIRPSVLLADNHAQVLEIVAGLLKDEFKVVGAASNGLQVLNMCDRLDPDVVVLDIGMPELDGFQTLEKLRQAGSRAKVVMLTMYESDAYVAAAINSGAQGYVLKSDIHSDLAGAIDHALAGRAFVPSLTSVFTKEKGHAVQFHKNDGYFLDEASQFVGEILRSGELMVVSATEETRTGIARRLKEKGIKLEAVTARAQYVVLDAEKTIAKFMRNGKPDPDIVAGVVADLDRWRISFGGPQSRLTLFGEMAAVLFSKANPEAAAELEHIWDNLTRELPFFTLCSYSEECFQNRKSRELFPKVCTAHHAVSHTVMA